MTATIRSDTSTTSTSRVNRGRTQTRRLTGVPAGCDEWEKKPSFGRKDFNYAVNPHRRSHTRKQKKDAKNASAKTRRIRQRERDLKHFTLSEALCEKDCERGANDDPDLAKYYEEVEDERPQAYHADTCFEAAAAELLACRTESVLQGVHHSLAVAPREEMQVDPEVMYFVRVTGEGDEMTVKAEPMQPTPLRERPIIVKFGSDFCFAPRTFTYELAGDGTKCLVRKINDEFLVMACDHFMDHPEDINDDDVWMRSAIGELIEPTAPDNPQCEDIVGKEVDFWPLKPCYF